MHFSRRPCISAVPRPRLSSPTPVPAPLQVDDVQINRTLIRRTLEVAGAAVVVEAADGQVCPLRLASCTCGCSA